MNDLAAPLLKSARKTKGAGHTRRAEFLQAAERIFVAEGQEGATIRRIAEEVGVSSTALYLHFQDKTEILLQICDQAAESLRADIEAISRRPGDPGDRLRAILLAYGRFAQDHPSAYRMIYCAAAPDLERRRIETAKAVGPCFQNLVAVLEELAAAGRLRPASPGVVAQALAAAVHGLIALPMARPELGWAPAPALEQTLIDGLLAGFLTA